MFTAAPCGRFVTTRDHRLAPLPALLLVFLLTAPLAAQTPAPTEARKMNTVEALGKKYPFPLDIGFPPGHEPKEFTRQKVVPQQKPKHGFELVLRKGLWQEVPCAAETLESYDAFVPLLRAVADVGGGNQMFLSVEQIFVRHDVLALDYLDFVAGTHGWLEAGRQVFLRQEGDTQRPVANILALLPVDPKTGERTVARVGLVIDGKRVFLCMVGVRESLYPAWADEMALAVLSFAFAQAAPSPYAESLRPVRLQKDSIAAQFEVADSWGTHDNVPAEKEAAGVGLGLEEGGKVWGAMSVFVYAKSAYPELKEADRIRLVQGAVGKMFGARDWRETEVIDFVASRALGPKEGRIHILTADEAVEGQPARKGALELRVAWLETERFWVQAWLFTYSRDGDAVVQMVAKRAFSIVMDTLELR